MMPVYDRTVEQEVAKKFIKVSIALSTLLVLAFIHTIKWDEFFIEVIPLQIKSLIGGLSAEDADRFASICKIRKNLDCVETMISSKFNSNPQNIEALAELGKVQFLRKEYRESANTFAIYFKQGGLSVDASYDYARVLGEVGLVEQSAQYYDRVLASKPDAMQVTVTQSYVRMLVSHGKNDQAKAIIESIRSKGGNASLFMENEMQQIAKVGP